MPLIEKTEAAFLQGELREHVQEYGWQNVLRLLVGIAHEQKRSDLAERIERAQLVCKE